jgi:hypothetical protein
MNTPGIGGYNLHLRHLGRHELASPTDPDTPKAFQWYHWKALSMKSI